MVIFLSLLPLRTTQKGAVQLDRSDSASPTAKPTERSHALRTPMPLNRQRNRTPGASGKEGRLHMRDTRSLARPTRSPTIYRQDAEQFHGVGSDDT
jgi:hypothetical protein